MIVHPALSTQHPGRFSWRQTASALIWIAAAYLLSLLTGYVLGVAGIRRHHLESATFILIAIIVFSAVTRTSGEPPRFQTHHPRHTWVGPLLILTATLLYAPIVTTGLFADDFVLLDAARHGRWTVWRDLFRPALFLVWRIADAAAPSVAPALHAINIALHGVNGVLVAAIGRRLGLSRPAAVSAGVLFVCFPAAVEAVAWPAGIQDVLMTTFVLIFLIMVLTPTWSSARAAMGCGALVAACLTKETAVVAPILALLLAGIATSRSQWTLVAISALVVGIVLAVRFSQIPLPSGYGGTLSRYAIKELLVRPFATLVMPLREKEIVGMPWAALLLASSVVVALCVAASSWTRQDETFRRAVALSAFVLVSIAPVYSFFHVTGDLHGSRYLYLGSSAWALFLANLIVGETDGVGAGLAIAVLIAVCWGIAARGHLRPWLEAADTRERIFSAATQVTDDCARAAVDGLPAVMAGVPLFVNGFPEAMRDRMPVRTFRVAPDSPAEGECRFDWTGAEFRRASGPIPK